MSRNFWVPIGPTLRSVIACALEHDGFIRTSQIAAIVDGTRVTTPAFIAKDWVRRGYLLYTLERGRYQVTDMAVTAAMRMDAAAENGGLPSWHERNRIRDHIAKHGSADMRTIRRLTGMTRPASCTRMCLWAKQGHFRRIARGRYALPESST